MPTQEMESWLERVLGFKHAESAPAAGAGTVSITRLGKARIEWIGVRRTAVAEIGRLRDAVSAEFKDDQAQAGQLAAALAKIGQRIAWLDPTLEDQLDAVLNADDRARPGPIATARDTLQKFISYLESDPLLATIDGNEVLPSMAVVAPMRTALGNIKAALG